MRWNRSFYFATSVGLLADRIGGGDGRPPRAMKRQPLLLAWFALGLLALAGCSSTELGVHLAKTATIDTPQSRPLPHAARKDYKLGKPYVVEGTWYYPSYEPYYDRTGVASWYGSSSMAGRRRSANAST